MKKFALALSGVIALAGLASAADIPARTPVVKAPAMVALASWTGFYVNAGVGYGLWAADTQTINTVTGLADLSVAQRQGGAGWLGTAGAGFDYQATSNIVFGVFGDFDLASIKGTIQDQNAFTAGTTKLDRAWAVGARAGWLATPQILGYVNGGYTGAHFGSAAMVNTITGASVGVTARAITTNGWFVGGGTEYSFASGWYWRNEYRLAHYGTRDFPVCVDATGVCGSVPGPFNDSIRFDPYVQTIRTEIVYKFNWAGGVAPAPSVAAWPESSVMPTKARPARVVAANWTGVYVNAGGGYGLWAADTQTIGSISGLPRLGSQRQGGRGWLGTAGVGFDYQATDRIVVGIFGDYDLASIKGTIQDQDPLAVANATLNSAWSAGARAGWLVTPAILTYVNGGFTNARFQGGTAIQSNTGRSYPWFYPDFTTSGYFLGGGVETMLASNWFWRSEYRRAQYNNGDFVVCGTAGCGAAAGFGPFVNTIRFRPVVQTIRTEVVYKFNWMR